MSDRNQGNLNATMIKDVQHNDSLYIKLLHCSVLRAGGPSG